MINKASDTFLINVVCLVTLIFIACNSQAQDRNQESVTISKQDIVAIDMAKRQEILSMTAEGQLQFWNDKFDRIAKMEWTEEERQHILSLKDFFNAHPGIFKKEQDGDELVNLEAFVKEWRNKGANTFGWDMNLMRSMVESALQLKDKSGNLALP